MTPPQQIDVFLLPSLAEAENLTGRVCVVIDVLRATTTIVHALAAGAKEVVPCLEVDEARRIAAEIGPAAVLGGERAGGKISGFDLGNSPAEYTPGVLAAKTLVFTTTNGTRALARCQAAERVLIGAFVNFSAICGELAASERVALICGGTDGEVTREDALLAGAIVVELTQSRRAALNDQAEIAADAWRTAVRLLTDRPLGMTLRDSRGGRNLIGIGHESDIDLAAQIDRFHIVPELDLATWRIRLP
ncbi:MAG TPA: 2-phosphosulfolactate phosphatase [Pirellulaceae bacterium]|nr:2-phosphosulfolactate phosphatase [Pirellulaceae bacterium]